MSFLLNKSKISDKIMNEYKRTEVRFVKKSFTVGGMSCAACSTRVENAVSKLDGIEKCSVNLLTGTMITEGDADTKDIIDAVEKAGYSISPMGEKSNIKDTKKETGDMNKLIKRLSFSVLFLIALMYISMGNMMWGWPLPSFFESDHISMGIAQMLLTICVMVINKKFFINGFKSLFKGAPNMDSLVAIGSGASFGYSVFALFAMSFARNTGNHAGVIYYMNNLYFESSAMILTLITLGKLLEEYSKGKTTNALKGLIDLSPKKATVLIGDEEVTIDIADLEKGDIFIVKPGESIASDGIVIEGFSSVDESSLTGESIPVDKEVGSKVSGGTINKFGFLKCEATHIGEETALAKIIKLVSDASATKAPIAKIADKVSGVFVPVVIVIAFITTVIWLILGESVGFSLARGISVLVISCPCALGLATPVAIMVANGVGAKNGILFKNAESLEQTGKTRFCVFDKTGTITNGTPIVTDIIPYKDTDEKEFLNLAFSLEKMSEHPLSKAIIEYGEGNGAKAFIATGFEILPGFGLVATINGKEIRGGNVKYICKYIHFDDDTQKVVENLSKDGKTPILFSSGKDFLGIIAVADTIKDDSKDAIDAIKKMGIETLMLTGDNENTAKAIADKCNIDRVIANVLPDEKAGVIKKLKETGKVTFVGDGINDAPALTEADIGIAIGRGTDIAIDAADVVAMHSSLTDIAKAIVLSRKTITNIKENLFWAFLYNTIGIPLATGIFISSFGWELNPVFGALAMSLSSFCVVSNALRLNYVKLNFSNKKEKKTMEKTIKVEGMMCPHCEARVKKVLEETEGIYEAVPSHKDKTVVIKSDREISFDLIKEKIENEGYKVIE